MNEADGPAVTPPEWQKSPTDLNSNSYNNIMKDRFKDPNVTIYNQTVFKKMKIKFAHTKYTDREDMESTWKFIVRTHNPDLNLV